MGSPTYLAAGRDLLPVEGPAHAPRADACRVYARSGGRVGPLPELARPGRRPSGPRPRPCRRERAHRRAGARTSSCPTTDGGEVSLEELAGAAVVVAFWCNHCPYVRAWEDRFNDVARRYSDRGVATVAICANDAAAYPADSFDEMVVRAQREGLRLRLRPRRHPEGAAGLWGRAHPGGLRARRAGPGGLPRRDRRQHRPRRGSRRTYLTDALDAVLAGGIPQPAETRPVGCTIKWTR